MRRIAGASILLLLTIFVAPAAADLYQWTDADGVRHYTSDPESIPEAYRAGARDIGSPRTREAPAAEPRRAAGDSGVMRFSGGAPIMASVAINGVGLRLMIDTGADRTLLSSAAASRSGLDVSGARPIRILGVTGTATAGEIVVAQIEVAGARVGPVRVIVHDTPATGVDGLLGRDVLDYFTLTVQGGGDGASGLATLTPR
jgi:clan AA aspartic protease (TIGR02281 family)